MKTNKTISAVFFLFIAQGGFAQAEAKQLHGKVKMFFNPVEGVNIINNNTQQSVVSDADGSFLINARVGEILFFFFS